MPDSGTIEELSLKFGELREPDSMYPWEMNRTPLSICEFDGPLAANLAQLARLNSCNLLRHSSKSVTFIWVMDSDGKVLVAVEELAELPNGLASKGYPRRRGYPVHPADDKKLGHPTLLAVDRKMARIAGELFLDITSTGDLTWHVNDNSGRYCRKKVPSKAQKKNILAYFRALLGEDVRFDDVTEKAS